jgi:hypothetical protein
MPGFLSSVVYVTSSFLLGVVLVNQIVRPCARARPHAHRTLGLSVG